MNEERTPDEIPEAIEIPRARARWERTDSVALIIVLIAAAALRFVSLANPGEMVFDEVYYAKDACFYVLNSEDPCQVNGSQAEVHPPVGKWLIGAGIKAFGFDSFGWRFVPALAGVATIALLFLLARRLFGSWLWASIAAGLLAIDPLHFVQSRTSMLDIFIPMFGLATVLFLIYDRDRILEGPRAGLLAGRGWRAAAGLAAGLAISTKWTGAFFLLLAMVLAVVWEAAARQGTAFARLRRALAAEGPSLLLWLVLLPIGIYVLSYVGQIQGKVLAVGDGSWLDAFIDHHRYMWNFHTQLDKTHGYQSPPWSWILIKRPVSYFFCAGEDCNPAVAPDGYQEIFATGSPLVWWTSIVAGVGVAIEWIRRRGQHLAEGVILAGVAFTYGPWLIPGADRPAVFIFYLLPTVPFLLLAVTYWMRRIFETWEGRAATALFLTGAALLFLFYYPLLTKRTLPQAQWQQRIWIFDACDKPPGESVISTITVTENGQVRETTTETQDSSSLPPLGWCWI